MLLFHDKRTRYVFALDTLTVLLLHSVGHRVRPSCMSLFAARESAIRGCLRIREVRSMTHSPFSMPLLAVAVGFARTLSNRQTQAPWL